MERGRFLKSSQVRIGVVLAMKDSTVSSQHGRRASCHEALQYVWLVECIIVPASLKETLSEQKQVLISEHHNFVQIT